MKDNNSDNRQIIIWLLACCFFIFLMVTLGGLTRLTESGLSITEWKPVSGIIPPLSEAKWQEEFSLYQQSPEYKYKNLGMNLEEFKGIFWLEFIHRLVGRTTGFVFLLPLIYFFVSKRIETKMAAKLLGIFALGGMQGLVGWFMVKSGLKDQPFVSHYWLAFHLCMAFIIYGLILWNALSLIKKNHTSKPIKQLKNKPLWILYFSACIFLAIIMIQVIFGAFVAGMHAGLFFNTFPDMDGQFIPPGLFILSPWLINFIENATTIQFTHRIIAYFVTLYSIIFCLISYSFTLTKALRHAITLLPVVVLMQVGLGVTTLLLHIPVSFASLHQVFALVLFTVVIFVIYELKVLHSGNTK